MKVFQRRACHPPALLFLNNTRHVKGLMGMGTRYIITTRGYGTTMALSTLRKLLSKRYLREGDGLFSVPESRRRERLFGQTGSGRLSCVRAASACMELLGSDYDPRKDTCLKAFVRQLAANGMAGDAAEVQ